MADQTVTAKFLADITDFQSKMRSLQASAKEAQASATQLSTGLAQSGSGMQTVGQNAEHAASGMRQMGTAGREAGGGINDMVSRMSQTIGDWQQLIAMAAQFVQWADKINQAAKGSATAFTTLMHSEMNARAELAALQSTSAASDFGKQKVADVAQYFLMLGKDAKTTNTEIMKVSDALAAMGKSGEQLIPAIEQLHKIQKEFVVTHDEMDQLAKDGVPAWDALAAGMTTVRGRLITVQEAQKEVDAGAIHGADAYKYMMNGMVEYTGKAEEQSKSLSAAWEQFGQEAAPLVVPLIEEMTKLLHAVNEVIAGVNQLKQAMEGLGGGMGGQIMGGIWNTFAPTLNPTGTIAGAINSINGYASGGTNLPSGWRVVGEDGPEIQYSPGGDTIIPSGADPMTFLGGGGARSALSSIGSMNQTVTVVAQLHVDGQLMAQKTIPHIAPIMRRQFSRRV